jgi:peroxiredoxin
LLRAERVTLWEQCSVLQRDLPEEQAGTGELLYVAITQAAESQMNYYLILVLGLTWVAIVVVSWLGWQLLRQSGRLLLRLEALEERLNELEFGEDDDHTNRFSNRSLAKSKIKRDGLKAGTPAPDFQLPRLDGRGDLGLSDLRGRRVLLVFSSPHCGPCSTLAPELEKFHREHPEVEVVMISKGEPKENRAKVKEHGLTFPIVLQQQWEISRRYAMFATPIAYLIDEQGIITHDVAVGTDAIQSLLVAASRPEFEAAIG